MTWSGFFLIYFLFFIFFYFISESNLTFLVTSQLPERQDKHTDMTDYNTLRCSLSRSVIKPKQTPVRHCAKIVKNCFLPLGSNTTGKQTVNGLKYHLENCHKDIYT